MNSRLIQANPGTNHLFIRAEKLWRVIGSVLSWFLVGLTLLIAVSPLAQAQEKKSELEGVSLKDLMELEVTSVSKHEEKLFEAPAAIYVITGDELRRSGHTSIVEALRMVPGLQVARANSHTWAVSSRGFNDIYANKLLVLIDGRSVYEPLFSGVFWDLQDTLLEDVDRIEVIRGPGATLWGANAVNGVINIVTKNTADTQGGLIVGGGGTEEQGFGGLRYGGKLRDDFHYRVFTKYFNRDNFFRQAGGSAEDAWDTLRGGFRLDGLVGSRDFLTIQGDVYRGEWSQMSTQVSLTPPFSETQASTNTTLGGNVLARWAHIFSERSDTTLQIYHDVIKREWKTIKAIRNTFDLDFQHHWYVGQRHEIVWGVGYRVTADDIDNSLGISFIPDSRTAHLFGVFVQDTIDLTDGLQLSLGSKFERNRYSGFEFQPSARLLWIPHARHTVWASVSRAIRSPNRSSEDIRATLAVFPDETGSAVSLSALTGSNVTSEKVMAYEVGYRVQPTDRWLLDLAAFHNRYTGLIGLEGGAPFFETDPTPAHTVLPIVFANNSRAESYGVELLGNVDITNRWKLMLGYTYLHIDIHSPAGASVSDLSVKGKSPAHQFQVRSNWNLPFRLKLDTGLYFVDELAESSVPHYVRVDAGLGWHLRDNLEVRVVGQNIFDRRHLEFNSSQSFQGDAPTVVERSVYGKVTWKF